MARKVWRTAGEGDERVAEQGYEDDGRGDGEPAVHVRFFSLPPWVAADHADESKTGLAAAQSNAAAPI